jgi:hypothetical protein
MTNEPIFAAVEHDLERGWDAFTDHLHRGHYHDLQPAATTTEDPAMSLATIVAAAEADAKKIDDSAHNFIDTHLPALRELAQSVEGSELFQVALSMVGKLDPAAEAMAVTVLKAIAGPAEPAPVADVTADPQPEPAAVA